MSVSNKQIFRNDALKHYMGNREENALLRFIPLPVTIFLWALLGFLILVGVLAWFEEIPVYATGSGIVLKQEASIVPDQDEAVAAIFLPKDQAAKIRTGLPVQVRIGTSGPHLESLISKVEPGIKSPYAACQQYGLGNQCSIFISQPAVVAIVRLETISATTYAGSMLTVEVTTGSQRIVSLFPGAGSW